MEEVKIDLKNVSKPDLEYFFGTLLAEIRKAKKEKEGVSDEPWHQEEFVPSGVPRKEHCGLPGREGEGGNSNSHGRPVRAN